MSPSKSLSSKALNILAYSSAVLAIMLSGRGGSVVQAIQIVLLRIVPNDGRFDVVFSDCSFESCTISPPHRHRHPTIDPHREFQRSQSEQALGLPQCEFLLPVNMNKSSLRCLSIDYESTSRLSLELRQALLDPNLKSPMPPLYPDSYRTFRT